MLLAVSGCRRLGLSFSGVGKMFTFAASMKARSNKWEAVRASGVLPWLLLVTLVITWGSSFILIKRGLEVFSPLQVGVLRIGVAALVLMPLAFSQIKRLPAKKWGYIVASGVIGNLIPAYLFALAETGIDSMLAGVLNSMAPLFTMVLAVLVFRLKVHATNVAGVAMGLVGAFGLIAVSGGNSFVFNFKYGAMVLIATICYAININLVKQYLQDVPSILITVFAFMAIGILSWIILFSATDFTQRMADHPGAWGSLGYILILAVLGTAVAMMLFYRLIQLTNAVFASSVTYLMPIVAVFWGVLDGEPFGASYFLWIALILVGVFLTNSAKNYFLKNKPVPGDHGAVIAQVEQEKEKKKEKDH